LELRYCLCETAFGWVGVLGSGAGLRRLTLPRSSVGDAEAEVLAGFSDVVADDTAFTDLCRRLRAYFSGQQVSFPDALDLSFASPFYRAVWEATRTVPYGEVRSYGWLAAQTGRPRAVRAVGGAMAANQIPIIIPCHRIVGSNGSLVGFGGGLEMKRRLLELEGCALKLVSRGQQLMSRVLWFFFKGD